MRSFPVAIGITVGLLHQSVLPSQPSSLASARALLQNVHKALGGSDLLVGVKTLSITGALTAKLQISGGKSVPSAGGRGQPPQTVTQRFDWSISLPEQSLERRYSDETVRYSGFSGGTLLNRLVAVGDAEVAAFFPPDMIEVEKQSLSHFILALLVRTDTAVPFKLVGGDEASLTFRSSDGAECQIEVDPQTHLPSLLRYVTRERSLKGGVTGKVFKTEVAIRDFWDEGPLRLAHRFTTYVNGSWYAERRLLTIELNPSIDPQHFRK